MKERVFILVVLFSFLVFLGISFSQDDSKKAKFGYAFQIRDGLKYHIYSDCFVLKGKEFKEVIPDSGLTCKHCINKLYKEENQ